MSKTWKISNGTLRPDPGGWRSHIQLINAGVVIAVLLVAVLTINAVISRQSAKAKGGSLSSDSNSDDVNGKSDANQDIADPSVLFDKKSKSVAAYNLLGKWGVSVGNSKVHNENSIKKIASKFGFRRYYGSLDMNAIKGVGYPVIFEIKEGDSIGHVPVVGVWGKRFITDVEAGNHVVKEWVFERWTGNVYILWRNFKDINRTMKRGSRGGSVKWLHEGLSELGYANLGSNGYYGRITERAVLRFQSNNGIEGSGETGPLTMMLLYKYLPKYETPWIVFDLG